jgi:hypothetical protein
MSNYTPLGTADRWVGVAVLYERDAIGPQQRWTTPAVEPLIRIDIRLEIPWMLPETRARTVGMFRWPVAE